MSDLRSQARRIDFRMASKVQCGVALQMISGEAEATLYMQRCGVPEEVIVRVLDQPKLRRRRGTIDVPDGQMGQKIEP